MAVAADSSIGSDEMTRMIFIRAFETLVAELKVLGEVPGSLHDSRGQEAVAVGVCAELDERDVVFSGHRGIGHCLACGVDPSRILGELRGLPSGFGAGHAGGMHIFDPSSGLLGTNGIVGSSLPQATGAALAFQTLGTDACAVVFFGEGSVTTGAFHEALYLAGLWSLPIIFVCEHNGYVEFTPSEELLLNRTYLVGDYYDTESFPVDGVDVLAVRAAARSAREWVRAKRGPALLDCRVFRFRGHYEGDTQTYRPSGEVDGWMEAYDPIVHAAERAGLAPETLERLYAEGRHRVEKLNEQLGSIS